MPNGSQPGGLFEYPAKTSLFLGVVLLILAFLLNSVLIQGFAYLVAGPEEWQNFIRGNAVHIDPEYRYYRVMQGLSNLFTWGFAGLLWVRINGGFVKGSGLVVRTNGLAITIAPLIMIISIPFVQAFMLHPESFNLPESMKGIEHWIEGEESSRMSAVYKLLGDKSIFGLIMNLIVLGLIPAFAEELFFRAGLQATINRIVGGHLSVWITAFIFSFLHFQFMGFIPRVLLGAMLGYFFLRTGSLWVPVFAHFMHNSFNLFMGWLAIREEINPEIAKPEFSFSYSLALGSFAITAVLFYFFWIKTSKLQEQSNIPDEL